MGGRITIHSSSLSISDFSQGRSITCDGDICVPFLHMLNEQNFSNELVKSSLGEEKKSLEESSC